MQQTQSESKVIGAYRLVANAIGLLGAVALSLLGWDAFFGKPWGIPGLVLGASGMMAYVGIRCH